MVCTVLYKNTMYNTTTIQTLRRKRMNRFQCKLALISPRDKGVDCGLRESLCYFIHRLISPMHRTDVCIDALNFQPMNGIKQHLGELYNVTFVLMCPSVDNFLD